MARPIWSGSISFGLVNVPVRLHTVVRDRQVHFHMMTPDGACRLRRKLYCPDTGKEYDFGETSRGYEVAPEQYVIIEDEELDRLKPEQGHAVEIQEFVDLVDVDPVYFDRPYYVSPDKGGAKGYRLLVEAIEHSGKVGIARFVMRQRQHLAVLRVRDHALVLETMHYHDEVAEVSELDLPDRRTSVNERERALAVQIIESMATTFEPERYKDEYREQLEELIRQRAAGVEETALEEAPPEPGGKVIDLMEALKKSLARRTGEAGAEDAQPRGKATGHRSGQKSEKAGNKSSSQSSSQSSKKTSSKAPARGRTRKPSRSKTSKTASKASGTRSGSRTRRAPQKKSA
jgi:DNA end-binding protein Ku